MNNGPRRKLTLRTETLRTLAAGHLRAVRGGTVLVTADDPITAPPTDRDGGGPARLTEYTCICKG